MADTGGEAAITEEPVVAAPGLDRKTAVDAHVFDQLRRDGVGTGGLGVKPQGDPSFPSPLRGADGQVCGKLTAGAVTEQLVTLGEQHHNGAHVRVLLRDRAGEFLGAQFG